MSNLKPSNPWELVSRLLTAIQQGKGPKFPRINLVSPPACGKSFLCAQTIPQALKTQVEQVVCSDRMESCELIGTKELVEGKGGVITSISYGPAARALKHGRPLLLDEADMTNRDVRGILHGLMDDAPFCTDAAGNRINAEPGYMVLLTSNTTPDCFEPAIRSRIEYTIRFTEPHPDSMTGWPKELRAANLAAYRQRASQFKWAAEMDTRRATAYLAALRMFDDDHAAAAQVTFGDAWEEILSVLVNQR